MNQPRSTPPDLPGFTLVRGIGGGGFADVFLYNQHHPNRPVAVKVLRAEHLSETSLRQFANEADVMAQVSTHPYIVTIFTSGVAPDGRPFIVMEHYPGDHFGLRARGGRLAVAEVLRVGAQVAAAVETAHRAGILHRDIKPANILTSEYGRPGLTDFGIAGVQIDGTVEAAAGLTVAFSPREVLLDEHAAGTVTSDVYSLCATLFALLAGHSPFWIPGGDNSDHAVFDRVINGQHPLLQRQDAPASLAHLLANGLSPDPAVRPQSALALGRAIQNIEQELALAPTPIDVRDDAAPVVHRNGNEESGVEEEGTRRSAVKVVDPDVPPGPAQQRVANPVITAIPAAPAPSTTQPRPGATPDLIPSASWSSTGSGTDRGWAADSTVAEDPMTVRKAPPPPAETSGAAQPSAKRRGLLISIGAGILAVVVIIALAAVVTARSSENPAPSTTPKPSASAPKVSVLTAAPQAPTGLTALVTPAGELTVTFTPPPATDGVTYRVSRTSGRWPDGSTFFDAPATPATITGLAPGDKPCVTVAAVMINGRISDPSAEVCAAATTPTTVP